LCFGLAKDHTLPKNDIGFFGGIDKGSGGVQGLRVGYRVGLITAYGLTGGITEIEFIELRIFRNVDQYGARTTGFGNIKGFCHDFGNFRCLCNLVIPFGHRGGDPYDIGFLEGIRTQQVTRHLAGDTHNWCGIDLGIGNARYQVGGPRAGSRHGNPYLSRYTCITLGGMYGPLFMAGKDMAKAILKLIEFVVYGHDGTAGIPVNQIDTFRQEAVDQGFSSTDP